MKVHAYHDPRVGLTDNRILDLFRRNWESRGWEISILGPDDATRHPRALGFSEWVARFPTQNPREYELACYQRWLPMALRGGLAVDTDVLNNGLTPDMLDLSKMDVRWDSMGSLPFSLEASHVPCALWGREDQYEAMLDLFSNTKPSGHHTSDMLIFIANAPGRSYKVPLCSQYARAWNEDNGTKGWRDYPMVHFASASIPTGRSKFDVMNDFVEGRL